MELKALEADKLESTNSRTLVDIRSTRIRKIVEFLWTAHFRFNILPAF